MRDVLDDYESNYEALLRKSGKSTMEVKRLRTIAIELFKTLNNQNPSFMRVIFYRSPHVTTYLYKVIKQQFLVIKV